MTIIPSPGKVAYTLNETAEVLSVSRATINRLVRAGDLRVSRLGWKTVRVTHEALMDYLRSKEETGGVKGAGRRSGQTKRKPGRRNGA